MKQMNPVLVAIFVILLFGDTMFAQQEFFDNFDDGVIDNRWVRQGLNTDNESGTHLQMNDIFQDDDGSGPLLSTLTFNTGYSGSVTVEVRWEDYATNENTTFHIFLGSSNGNHVAFGLYRTDGLQQIWYIIFQGGVIVSDHRRVYPHTRGFFKLVYTADTRTISAFYKTNEPDNYSAMSGNNFVHSNFQNPHWITYICDNWLLGGPAVVRLDWSKIAYDEADGQITEVLELANDFFDIKVDENSGGIVDFRRVNDTFNTNYVIGKASYGQYDVDDSRWLGDVITQYSLNGGNWNAARTSMSDDIRQLTGNDTLITVSYGGNSASAEGIKDFDLIETYRLEGDALLWEMKFTNTSGGELEFGDIGLPIPEIPHAPVKPARC